MKLVSSCICYRGNFERNLLLAESNFSDNCYRELPAGMFDLMTLHKRHFLLNTLYIGSEVW